MQFSTPTIIQGQTKSSIDRVFIIQKKDLKNYTL